MAVKLVVKNEWVLIADPAAVLYGKTPVSFHTK